MVNRFVWKPEDLQVLDNPLDFDADPDTSLTKASGKVYLNPGQQPPNGEEVQQGARGGLFYISAGGASSIEEDDDEDFRIVMDVFGRGGRSQQRSSSRPPQRPTRDSWASPPPPQTKQKPEDDIDVKWAEMTARLTAEADALKEETRKREAEKQRNRKVESSYLSPSEYEALQLENYNRLAKAISVTDEGIRNSPFASPTILKMAEDYKAVLRIEMMGTRIRPRGNVLQLTDGEFTMHCLDITDLGTSPRIIESLHDTLTSLFTRDSFASSRPNKTITVSVLQDRGDNELFNRGAAGYTHQQTGQFIHLSQKQLEYNQEVYERDPVGYKERAQNRFSTVAGRMTPVSYYIAHEFGHARRRDLGRMVSREDHRGRISEYGKTNDAEAYAESYTQWFFDRDVVPQLRKLAIHEGWPDAE